KFRHSLKDLIGTGTPHRYARPREMSLNLPRVAQTGFFRGQRQAKLRREKRQRERQVLTFTAQCVEQLQATNAVAATKRTHHREHRCAAGIWYKGRDLVHRDDLSLRG